MAINVTPIPKLAGFADPAFTLGTANTAGDARTTVASNSTLLAFDVTVPSAVGVASVGTAVTAPRRDHVHPGVTGGGTVVDEAITRYNGTSGNSLQGYSSLSPTISDAGIISLTSGALKFPDPAISSSDLNTLDDYEEGTWIPIISDTSLTDKDATYSIRKGTYVKIGKLVRCQFRLKITGFGTLTTTSGAYLIGMPFPAANVANTESPGYLGYGDGLAITALAHISGITTPNTTYFTFWNWSYTTGSGTCTLDMLSSDAGLIGTFSYDIS